MFCDTVASRGGCWLFHVAKIRRESKLFCDDICDKGRAQLIGYARVSTDDQDLSLQRAALQGSGCTRTYEEKISGAKRDRPELIRMLDHIRAGDVVVVSRLDRLARSTRDLLEIAEQLKAAEAGLRSLHEPWADTTSPAGRMVLTVFAGIAEFERELIHERTSTGRTAAKSRGVRFGRPPKLTVSVVLRPRPWVVASWDRPKAGDRRGGFGDGR